MQLTSYGEMEQPAGMMNSNSSTLSPNSAGRRQQPKMDARKMASAEELIKHYESKGMETKEASVKVINDLQKALFRVLTTDKKQHQQKQAVDVINGRMLSSIDMKLDSKPGYPQMLGIGVASAAVFRGLETLVFPQLASSFANIWNAVRSTTNGNNTNI